MRKTRRKNGRGQNQSGPYAFELRLRLVRMYLEEDPVHLICKEAGVGRSTKATWARKYRLQGEDGRKSL